MQQRRPGQRGFTLVELMVVVALLGVLAKVVAAELFKSSRAKTYQAEVSAVFSEVMAKELQYRQEFGTYRSVALCLTTPNPAGVSVDTACNTIGSDWQKLRLAPGLSKITCAYQVVIGCSPADTITLPAGAKFRQGNGEWFFVVATCGTGSDTTTFVSGSQNAAIQKFSGAAAYGTNGKVTCVGRGA